MKILSILFLLITPFATRAQQIITASSEPVALYQEINESLNSGKPRHAIRYFDKVITLYVEQGRECELPEKYFGMALGLALSGHYRESIRYHKKAIKAHRRFRTGEPLEMSINLGLTYQLAGKEKKARRILGETM